MSLENHSDVEKNVNELNKWSWKHEEHSELSGDDVSLHPTLTLMFQIIANQ